ncbi:1,2-oxophytodienoate reductase, partial [Nitrosospira sp. NpAV]
GATSGPRDYRQGEIPFDYSDLKDVYQVVGGRAAWMLNNGYDLALAQQTVATNQADLIAFGHLFISNPDLVERLRQGASLTPPDKSTFYGGNEHGYTDYPFMSG